MTTYVNTIGGLTMAVKLADNDLGANRDAISRLQQAQRALRDRVDSANSALVNELARKHPDVTALLSGLDDEERALVEEALVLGVIYGEQQGAGRD